MDCVEDLRKRIAALSSEQKKSLLSALSEEEAPDSEVAAFIAEVDAIELPSKWPVGSAKPLSPDIEKSEYIPGKRGRRKGQVDKNSARQRVWCAVRSVLEKYIELHCHEVWDKVMEATDLPYDVVRTNAFACPGVRRAEYWTLEAA